MTQFKKEVSTKAGIDPVSKKPFLYIPKGVYQEELLNVYGRIPNFQFKEPKIHADGSVTVRGRMQYECEVDGKSELTLTPFLSGSGSKGQSIADAIVMAENVLFKRLCNFIGIGILTDVGEEAAMLPVSEAPVVSETLKDAQKQLDKIIEKKGEAILNAVATIAQVPEPRQYPQGPTASSVQTDFMKALFDPLLKERTIADLRVICWLWLRIPDQEIKYNLKKKEDGRIMIKDRIAIIENIRSNWENETRFHPLAYIPKATEEETAEFSSRVPTVDDYARITAETGQEPRMTYVPAAVIPQQEEPVAIEVEETTPAAAAAEEEAPIEEEVVVVSESDVQAEETMPVPPPTVPQEAPQMPTPPAPPAPPAPAAPVQKQATAPKPPITPAPAPLETPPPAKVYPVEPTVQLGEDPELSELEAQTPRDMNAQMKVYEFTCSRGIASDEELSAKLVALGEQVVDLDTFCEHASIELIAKVVA